MKIKEDMVFPVFSYLERMLNISDLIYIIVKSILIFQTALQVSICELEDMCVFRENLIA